ncbi:AMP-binding enzyme [Salsuginibacillus halophilus]|uniref:AMP-binding enzyme n=1 Tax=Salsuginibacillus halophilus TaxID=517424 RepID=A0A2P8HW71_9BACI|nr:AMP-binding enzyme [Salsuginibacillus halophilus]
MQGYEKNEALTAESYQGDWLLTGDMAMQDDEGYLWVIDRKKDIIISGGVNVYPREIEDTLKEHPVVQDAAVIGVPHDTWGESIHAYVVATEALTEPVTALRSFLEGRLASYKLPHEATVVDDLPRNPTGKILKGELRKMKEEAK